MDPMTNQEQYTKINRPPEESTTYQLATFREFVEERSGDRVALGYCQESKEYWEERRESDSELKAMRVETPYTKIPMPPEGDPRLDEALWRTDTDGWRRGYHEPTLSYWDSAKVAGPKFADETGEQYQARIASLADAPAAAGIGSSIERYVDKAMFEAEEFSEAAQEVPRVFLLSGTPDPLGSVAAMSMMYEGRVIRDLSEITDDERRHYFDECFKTTLKAPLEAIDLHMMVEGVTRSHTHQEVRQRTAVFAQESMRFAVKENLRESVRPQPSIRGDRERLRRYFEAIDKINEVYRWMIADGVPAEDARGLLPHDTLTRLHHKVNLRNLMDEIGKRLCTQAQFEWRAWGADLRRQIGNYEGASTYSAPLPGGGIGSHSAGWQWQYIANSPIFVPICFNSGACMFKAAMDRGCTIRERVEAGRFDEIETREWASDPKAAWVK